MRTLAEIQEKLSLYSSAELIYEPKLGYIAWHYSTGDNIEVLYVEAAVVGLGQGAELYRRMIQRLLGQGERPYHSVFGYQLESNECAERFYRKMGWTQVRLGRSIYAGDGTILMWITWDDLLARLQLEERQQ